ncbi:MAG TPA: integrase [Alphaproteobacteria bacterium]|nr:integrase [Alphaproteobacteria bacterium]
MENLEALAPERITEFLSGSAGIDFTGQSRTERYAWLQATLTEQQYFALARKQRGTVRALLGKVAGLSMPQITRLIRSYRNNGEIRVSVRTRRRFPVRYTVEDLELLIEVDRAHQRLSGPATRRIFEREWQVFGRKEYARLAEISVAHLYNLRHSAGYRQRAAEFSVTTPSGIAIGERRRPEPQGAPGHLRVDTVHQGDWEGEKGVYHINAVDAVTQWEIVGCAGRISEQYLLPVLEAMLHQFPFRILGFHADNGSEFVNHTVAELLNKLLVEFTRSRPNRSSDNALVEGKNGAIIRKHLGYGHIAREHADRIQRFYTAHFNPYLNYHRPCGFAHVELDARGRRQRRYRQQDYATPYEKLRSLPAAHRYLKEGLRWELLDRFAYAVSDTEAARRMMRAKTELLRQCKLESPFPPRFAC